MSVCTGPCPRGSRNASIANEGSDLARMLLGFKHRTVRQPVMDRSAIRRRRPAVRVTLSDVPRLGRGVRPVQPAHQLDGAGEAPELATAAHDCIGRVAVPGDSWTVGVNVEGYRRSRRTSLAGCAVGGRSAPVSRCSTSACIGGRRAVRASRRALALDPDLVILGCTRRTTRRTCATAAPVAPATAVRPAGDSSSRTSSCTGCGRGGRRPARIVSDAMPLRRELTKERAVPENHLGRLCPNAGRCCHRRKFHGRRWRTPLRAAAGGRSSDRTAQRAGPRVLGQHVARSSALARAHDVPLVDALRVPAEEAGEEMQVEHDRSLGTRSSAWPVTRRSRRRVRPAACRHGGDTSGRQPFVMGATSRSSDRPGTNRDRALRRRQPRRPASGRPRTCGTFAFAMPGSSDPRVHQSTGATPDS